jgi:hypothetical protein
MTHASHFRILLTALTLCASLSMFPARSAAQSEVVLQEGNDFATRILGDPWDMDDFEDISTSINGAGRLDLVRNFSVADGILRGVSVNRGYVNLLFGGYIFTVPSGKSGARFPIASSTYRCLHTRMKVDSAAGDDWYPAWYTRDESTFGAGQALKLHNDGLPAGAWRLYSVNLTAVRTFSAGFASRPQWQMLRLFPSYQANAPFEIDWVRLTDCNAVNHELTWTALPGQTRLWAGINGTSRDIPIAVLNAGQTSYTWDVQGLQPGRYRVGVEANGQMTWLAQSLRIVPAPVFRVVKPSMISGEDYATVAGNPWDMSDAGDINSVRCTTAAFANGVLNLDTPRPAQLDPNCRGQLGTIGEADAQFYLNTPTPIDPGRYRYLSMRLNSNGTQQVPADGMITRLLWHNGSGCVLTQQAVPYDVYWQTVMLDLHDPVFGTPEETTGCAKSAWRDTGTVPRLRFDPNENWTGNLVPAMDFRQQIDWIRLTRMDEVKQGRNFPIQLSFDRDPAELRQIEVFYTTNPDDPTRNRANGRVGAPGVGQPLPQANGSPRVFLPLLSALGNTSAAAEGLVPDVPNEWIFTWFTSGVTPGEYYICARANDGTNVFVRCSDAPVNVLP